MGYPIIKRYSPRLGLSLVTDDLLREPDRTVSMKNWTRLPSGVPATRNGFQVLAYETTASDRPLGFLLYSYVDDSGDQQVEMLTTQGGELVKFEASSFSITNSTGGDIYIYSRVDSATNTVKFRIRDSSSTLLDQDCDDGITGSYTITTLASAINALTNISCSSSNTEEAAFIPVIDSEITVADSASVSIPFYVISSPINQPEDPITTDVFNDSNVTTLVQNLQAVKLNKCLYIRSSHDALMKYDGQGVYRPGMIQGELTSVAAVTGSSTLTGDYQYIITFEFTDAQGNTVEGRPSTISSTVSPSSEDVDVTIDTSGFNAAFAHFYNHFALPTSNQTGVTTIAVDDGAGNDQTLAVGDEVYFLDRSTSTYVTRTVTAASGSSITISGSAVNVNNNDIMSTLKANVYRTTDGGTDLYLAATVPVDPSATTVVWRDTITDANLGAQYLYPVTGAEHREIGNSTWKCVGAYQGLLILGGNNEGGPNVVRFSDSDSPEYFPVLNQFTLESTDEDDYVSAFATYQDFFFAFKRRAMYRVSGTLVGGDIVVDPISRHIGCAAQLSVQQVTYGGASRYIWLGMDGVYESVEGNAPRNIAGELQPIFTDYANFAPEYSSVFRDSSKLQFELAVAVNDYVRKKYILCIPAVGTSTTEDRYTNSSTRTFVYDYGLADIGQEPQWYEWNNWDMSAGALMNNGDLFFQSREGPAASFNSAIQGLLKQEGSSAGFDHVSAITSHLEFGSENLGEPGADKKFNRLRGYSLDTSVANNFTLTAKVYLDYSSTVHSNGSLAFTASERMPRLNLKAGRKAQAARVRFEHSTAGERPVLSGFEWEVAVPYEAKMVKRA